MNVVKRDGKVEDYNFSKVKRAVNKMFKACGKESDSEFLTLLKSNFDSWEEKCPDCEVSVDEIRDLVEKTLKKAGQKDVLKAAKKERDNRDRIRESKTKKSKTIKSKIEATNIENQNANVDELSFGGRKGEADSVYMKEYALYNCMSEMARNNHLNNEIYTHKLKIVA